MVVGGDQELSGPRELPFDPSHADLGVDGGGKVLLCGYYGEHNLGDDALLEVLLSQLPQGWEPLVTAHDQPMVQRRFGVATTDRRSLRGVLRALAGCDALVLGGGSLLQDSTSFKSLLYYAALIGAARLQGKRVCLWGQGLGPLHRRRSRLLVRSLLPLVNAISWRDPASASLAADWGIEAPVGSDPVWGLAPRAWQGGAGRSCSAGGLWLSCRARPGLLTLMPSISWRLARTGRCSGCPFTRTRIRGCWGP